MELITALWKGGLSLGKTYWLFGFLGSFLLGIPLIILEEFPLPPSLLTTAFLFFYSTFVFVYAIFISVAVWRSAGRYQGPYWLAALARLAVVLGVLRAIVEIGKAAGLVT